MSEFDEALSNYVREFANGGAIRHFVDLGYSTDEIKSALDFPMSVEDIAKFVWKVYVDNKTVCLSEEDIQADYIIKTDYVKDYNKYGKTSLRRVTKKVGVEPRSYVSCNYGKIKYKDEDGFNRCLNDISDRSSQMIEHLPWPLETVYVDRNSKLGEAVIEFNYRFNNRFNNSEL